MDLSLSATGTDYYIEYNMIQNCKKKRRKIGNKQYYILFKSNKMSLQAAKESGWLTTLN